MLYLMRKIGESIIINDNIEITVVEVKGRSVKLGFESPPDVTILRKEIHQRIIEENIAAARSAGTGEVKLDDMEKISLTGKKKEDPNNQQP